MSTVEDPFFIWARTLYIQLFFIFLNLKNLCKILDKRRLNVITFIRPAGKGVGRKFSRRGVTEKRSKISKKIPKNNTI